MFMTNYSMLKKNSTSKSSVFMFTLHLYLLTACGHVRKVFNKCLLHLSINHKWFSIIGGLPGITIESLNAIKIKIKTFNLVCGLMDAMPTRN